MEGRLISCIYKQRSAYDKIIDVMDDEEVFNDIDSILFDRAKDYYETDPDATSIDIALVRSTVGRTYPRHADIIGRLVVIML